MARILLVPVMRAAAPAVPTDKENLMELASRKQLRTGAALVLSALAVFSCSSTPASDPAQTSTGSGYSAPAEKYTVPASAETTRTTGVASWKVVPRQSGKQIVGVGSDGKMVMGTRVFVDAQTSGSPITFAAMSTTNGLLQIERTGKIAKNTLTPAEKQLAGAASTDLKAYLSGDKVVYGCGSDSAWALLHCLVAIPECIEALETGAADFCANGTAECYESVAAAAASCGGGDDSSGDGDPSYGGSGAGGNK